MSHPEDVDAVADEEIKVSNNGTVNLHSSLVELFLLSFTGQHAKDGRAARFHFYPVHDIALLQQALADQPYLAAYGKQDDCWAQVAEALRNHPELAMPVTSRSARDRFTYILKLFQDEDNANLRKSGAEEEFDERDRLLTEVLAQQRTATEQKDAVRKREAADRESGKQIQMDALCSLKKKRTEAATDGTETDNSSETPKFLKRSRSDKDEVELLGQKEKRRAEELRNERLRLQVEATKADNDRERLRLEHEKTSVDAELERQRLQVKEEKVKLERLRLEADIKDRELQRRLQAEQSHAQMEFIANLTNKFLK